MANLLNNKQQNKSIPELKQKTAEFQFDDLDAYILANRFAIPELRTELRHAEIEVRTQDTFQNTEFADPYIFPWLYYASLCREAIRWKQASPRRTTQATRNHIDVEAIKAKRDIVAEAERYTKLRKSGQRFIGACPLHDDKHPSLVIYPDRQSWHCFQCNRGGDIFAFIQAAENTDFRGAAAILGGT